MTELKDQLKEVGVFGITVAVCYRFDIPSMITNRIASPLVSTLGLSLANDVGTVVSFGLILWVYNSWIWPNVKGVIPF